MFGSGADGKRFQILQYPAGPHRSWREGRDNKQITHMQTDTTQGLLLVPTNAEVLRFLLHVGQQRSVRMLVAPLGHCQIPNEGPAVFPATLLSSLCLPPWHPPSGHFVSPDLSPNTELGSTGAKLPLSELSAPGSQDTAGLSAVLLFLENSNISVQ